MGYYYLIVTKNWCLDYYSICGGGTLYSPPCFKGLSFDVANVTPIPSTLLIEVTIDDLFDNSYLQIFLCHN